MTAPGTANRLIRLLRALGLPTELPDIPEEELIAAMGNDKKNLGATLHVLSIPAIGRCEILRTDRGFFRGMRG